MGGRAAVDLEMEAVAVGRGSGRQVSRDSEKPTRFVAKAEVAMADNEAAQDLTTEDGHQSYRCQAAKDAGHFRHSNGQEPALARRDNGLEDFGAGGRTRTADPALMRRML